MAARVISNRCKPLTLTNARRCRRATQGGALERTRWQGGAEGARAAKGGACRGCQRGLEGMARPVHGPGLRLRALLYPPCRSGARLCLLLVVFLKHQFCCVRSQQRPRGRAATARVRNELSPRTSCPTCSGGRAQGLSDVSVSGARRQRTRERASTDATFTGVRGAIDALVDERLVDVGDHTATGDGRLDERVELLVATDGELEVARRDALHLEVLGGVARELEHLSGEVLKDRRGVHRRGGANAARRGRLVLEEAVDTANRELEAGLRGARDRLLLVAGLCARERAEQCRAETRGAKGRARDTESQDRRLSGRASARLAPSLPLLRRSPLAGAVSPHFRTRPRGLLRSPARGAAPPRREARSPSPDAPCPCRPCRPCHPCPT